MLRTDTSATHTGEFLGVPPTGRRVECDSVGIVRVENGRVVGEWAQPDLLGIYRQISDHKFFGRRDVRAPSTAAPCWSRRPG
jgi:SnoaL-like polyketide cyclase